MLQGLIFCVGVDSGVLKLYDIRSYDKGPFDTFVVRSQPISLHPPMLSSCCDPSIAPLLQIMQGYDFDGTVHDLLILICLYEYI